MAKATSKIPTEVIEEARGLFEYRNRIAHANIEMLDGKGLTFDALKKINDTGRGTDLDTTIERALSGDDRHLAVLAEEFGEPRLELALPSIGTDDIKRAVENLRTAERIIEALDAELNSADWPVAPG